MQLCSHRQHRYQMQKNSSLGIIFIKSQIHPALSPECCHPEPLPWTWFHRSISHSVFTLQIFLSDAWSLSLQLRPQPRVLQLTRTALLSREHQALLAGIALETLYKKVLNRSCFPPACLEPCKRTSSISCDTQHHTSPDPFPTDASDRR